MSSPCGENVARSHRITVTVAVALAILVGSVVRPRWFGVAGTANTAGLTAWLHLVGYAALGATVVPFFGSRWRGLAVAVVVATAYGAGIELLQFGLAYRTASSVDFAVNGLGATLGVAARGAYRRRRAPPSPTNEG
jgi:VanZ family protein